MECQFRRIADVNQDRQLDELRAGLMRARLEHDLARFETPKLKELADENLELKLRLGLLVRLLIQKEVITAEEYATLISRAESRP